MLRIVLAALVAATDPGGVDIAPGAHLTASSWANQTAVVEARDHLPRNAVDGDPETAWRPAAGDEAAWLRLDFTRPWPTRYHWRRVVARWQDGAAPARPYRWQVSRDGAHWFTLARQSAPGETDAIDVAGTGPYLRLALAPGDTAALAELQVFADSAGRGDFGPLRVGQRGNVVTLDWTDAALENVFLYRLTRTASLGGLEGGTAAVSAVLVEGTQRGYTDRVAFPALTSLDFQYVWTVEAYGPDGTRIAKAETAPRKVDARSPNPFALRGVVEGYYGPGYSEAEREDLLRFVGARGGNYYLYAPKLDPYHRDKWRTPYPAADEAQFRRLAEVGLDYGVRFAWSLSPGLDYAGTAADKAAALRKYQSVQALGVQAFALLMDDIDAEADVTSATLQVELANLILDGLRANDPDAQLIFVPTVYRGLADSLQAGPRRYLAKLADLDPDIQIMWTGPGVFSPTITRADIAPIAALVGRPLVIWDNYPVADFFFGRRLNLGAVEGRDADLADGTAASPVVGLLANPMWLPASNRLPLATVLDYLADPERYDPAAALADQLAREAPPEVRPLVAAWQAAFATFNPVGLDESEATRAVSAATEALDEGVNPGGAFARHAAALYVMPPALRYLYRSDLAGEWLGAAETGGDLGRAALLALQAGNEESAGADASGLRGEIAASLDGAKKRGWTVTEDRDAAWITRFLASKAPWRAGAPALEGSLPASMEVGRDLDASFALGDATAATLVGLPGATFEDGRLRWHAARTGVERWAVVSENAAGAAVRFGEIKIVEQKSKSAGGCAATGDGPPLWLGAALLYGWFRRVRGAPAT